ncbi:hypothetical protein CHU92_10910 [Flavobacterium cyanobacteriorum]|uniref:GEVED domain-containing protein n=1 Tax=Flavobacterium cyanobacteriorum TaxID=2022802 RepID=A0A255Z1U7_9FLAO|nr:GEVED domain-containing protein [Flavobacterium cyanobacteriorum]OYQ35477.1 hypothetical protein CHU92_10910 [Flavobacterium cyanobacteriorum]
MKKYLLLLAIISNNSFYAQTTNPAPYCAANFVNQAPFNLPDRLISNVSFGSLANNSGSNRWPGNGYVFYNNISAPSVVLNSSYQLTVNYNQNSTHRVAAFIDFNRDNDFIDAGEKVMDVMFPFNTGTTVNVQIPATAAIGETRLRVVLYEDDMYTGSEGPATSCSNLALSVGETEDYRINMVTSLSNPSYIQNDDIVLFPNPVADFIEIKSEKISDIKNVLIYDSIGKKVIDLSYAESILS